MQSNPTNQATRNLVELLNGDVESLSQGERRKRDLIMLRLVFISLVCSVAFVFMAAAQPMQSPPQTVLLWPDGAPGAIGVAPTDQPRLTLFPAPKAPAHQTRTAVLILPGGAYAMLATDHEGIQVAKWLNNLGVSAFMLEYRLGPAYHHPVQLEDASRALRWIRLHAGEYGVDPDRIGVWGFSAGGHLASTLGTHFDSGKVSATDSVDRLSSRPDFMVLAYPVIDALGPASEYSYQRLLGDHPDAKLVEEVSNEKHVTSATPPTFLVHASDDNAVSAQNSVNFYAALLRAGVPVEMHIYQKGGHGFGLAPFDPILSSWTSRLADWLRLRGLLDTN